MTLKQILKLESIPCVYLHAILKRLLAKVCFNASFMCLSRFVAFRGTFNDYCCWTQRCGLLSRTHLKGNGPTLTNWSKWICITLWWCFCKLLTSNWEVSTSRLPYHFINFTQFTQCFCHKFVDWWDWNKSSNWNAYLACIYMTFWRDCWQRFV